MQNFCPYCRTPLNRDARFCSRCGRPVTPASGAPPPPGPLPTRRSNLTGPLLAGLAIIGVCLCLAAAAAFFVWGGSGSLPNLATLLQPDTSPETEVDAHTLQTLEESVAQIEAAFRAGDVGTVINLTHPAMRADYQPIFEAHRTELGRVADLLATRQLVHATYGMAEYEVNEDGRTFIVVFEAWGEQWYLSSL